MYVNNDLKVTPGSWGTYDNVEILSEDEMIIAKLHDGADEDLKAIIAAVNFFKSIGIKELKEQKEYVVNEGMNRKDERQGIYIGLTHLLDAIQDTLVDDFGADENEVFNLTTEEE